MPLPEGRQTLNSSGDVLEVDLIDKNGTKRECELRELMGDVRDKFLNWNKKNVNPTTGQMINFNDAQSQLIAHCLFDRDTDKQCTIEYVRTLPAKTQNQLFDWCVELSGLNKLGEEQAKNSSS